MLKTQPSIPAYFLPGVSKPDLGEMVDLEFGEADDRVVLKLPRLTPTLLARIIHNLRVNRQEYLAKLTVDEIIQTLGMVADLWQDPEYPLRRRAEELLPAITGFSPPMITQTLNGMLEWFSPQNLRRLLEVELGDPRYLDEFRPSPQGFSRAWGPELTCAVFAGNVPGLPIANIVYGLLTKSAVLGKSSSEEPLFASLYAQSLASIDPRLASCVAMVWWKGGDEETEKLAFGEADTVVVYGGERAVNQVHRRIPPGTRFIPYGHKLSFGVIGRESLSSERVKETAARAAVDASVFDQQGCLSPQVFYLEEGGQVTPKEFARHLAGQMEAFNRKIPRGRISCSESARINLLRGSYEFRQLQEDNIALYASSPGTDWTVVFEDDQAFIASCLNRTIHLKPVADASEVPGLVAPLKQFLQTVGAALPPERLLDLSSQLGKLGVDRVCPLGRMTAPSIFWRHDGRFNVLDMVRWTDLEMDE